jgi:uncharacterized protein YjbI with pentapeptide repeats
MKTVGPDTLPPLDIHGAFVRRTDLSGAVLRGANLSHADAAGALFRGADFLGADLTGTILVGADLTDAKNLTIEQIRSAVTDETTVLPAYISAHQPPHSI